MNIIYKKIRHILRNVIRRKKLNIDLNAVLQALF
jgi:hypothetical protein